MKAVYYCECGTTSTTPGPCRSHPRPFRAMGPEMQKAIPLSRVRELVDALEKLAYRFGSGGRPVVEGREVLARFRVEYPEVEDCG